MRLDFNHFFHYAMGRDRAARSELLARYQHQILRGITVVMEDYIAVEGPAVLADLHLRTLDAIRTRNADRIDEVMDAHLAHLERVVAEEQHSAGGTGSRPV